MPDAHQPGSAAGAPRTAEPQAQETGNSASGCTMGYTGLPGAFRRGGRARGRRGDVAFGLSVPPPLSATSRLSRRSAPPENRRLTGPGTLRSDRKGAHGRISSCNNDLGASPQQQRSPGGRRRRSSRDLRRRIRHGGTSCEVQRGAATGSRDRCPPGATLARHRQPSLGFTLFGLTGAAGSRRAGGHSMVSCWVPAVPACAVGGALKALATERRN